jgi:hypothetical protein
MGWFSKRKKTIGEQVADEVCPDFTDEGKAELAALLDKQRADEDAKWAECGAAYEESKPATEEEQLKEIQLRFIKVIEAAQVFLASVGKDEEGNLTHDNELSLVCSARCHYFLESWCGPMGWKNSIVEYEGFKLALIAEYPHQESIVKFGDTVVEGQLKSIGDWLDESKKNHAKAVEQGIIPAEISADDVCTFEAGVCRMRQHWIEKCGMNMELPATKE